MSIEQTLQRWLDENPSLIGNNDYRLYNLIGYLLVWRKKKEYARVYEEIRGKRPDQLNKALKKMVSGTIRIPISRLRDEEQLNEEVGRLNYKKKKTNRKEQIRRVLLLFNILTLNETGDKRARFRFDLYCREKKWDIEHVNPQAESGRPDGIVAAPKTLQKYLRENRSLYRTYGLALTEDRVLVSDVFKKEFGQFSEYYQVPESRSSRIHQGRDWSDSNNDNISNLVLLDDGINSCQEFCTSDFLEKQQYIISQMFQNKFILPCTVKLFLKCYNEASDIEGVHTAWTERDKDQYLHSREGLVPTLMRFANGD